MDYAFEDSRADLRCLLRGLLANVAMSRATSHTPDRDVLDECFENEAIGLKMLGEYLDALPSCTLNKTIAELLRKIVDM